MSDPISPVSHHVRMVDEVCEGVGYAGLAIGAVSQLASRSSFSLVFPTYPASFSTGLAYGALPLLWNGLRSADRLFSHQWETSHDIASDSVHLAGAFFGFSSLIVGGLLGHRFSRYLVGLGSLTDLVDLVFVTVRHVEDPQQITTGQVLVQWGLTLFFGMPLRRPPTLDQSYPRGSFLQFDNGDRFATSLPIGQGGYASICPARDRETGVDLAIKIWLPRVTQGSIRSEIVLSEAVNRRGSPFIVRFVGEVTLVNYSPGLVMERLQGMSLRERLDRHGPLSMDEAVDRGIQVAKGLRDCHEAGVLHRDIKPGNIFLCSDGQTKILDFGIARRASLPTLQFPLERTILGTEIYIPPERYGEMGRNYEDRSGEVYSLCVTLWEAITNKRFGWNPQSRCMPDFSPELSPLRTTDVVALEEILQTGFDPNPFSRYPTMDELIAELQGWQRQYRGNIFKRARWGIARAAA